MKKEEEKNLAKKMTDSPHQDSVANFATTGDILTFNDNQRLDLDNGNIIAITEQVYRLQQEINMKDESNSREGIYTINRISSYLRYSEIKQLSHILKRMWLFVVSMPLQQVTTKEPEKEGYDKIREMIHLIKGGCGFVFYKLL